MRVAERMTFARPRKASERTGDAMIFEQEESLPLDERFRLWCGRLQFWRLCCNAACRRAHTCRGDLTVCVGRFADWADSVRAAAKREFNAREPETQALAADLERRVIRLSQTMTDNP